MKKSILTVFAIITVSLINFAQAQSVDDILAKHFKAVGQDRLTSAKAIHITAKLNQMGMEMPMEMKVKKPDLFIVTVEMQGQKMIQAFDGEKGWMIMPWISSDPQELSGEPLEQVKRQTNLEGELYNYKEKGATVEFAGKVNVDGKEAYRIKYTDKNGDEKEYFIDAESYLISKIKASVSAQGQTVDVEQVMSDFKTIDGVTMATKIESKSPMGTTSVIMEDIKFNENFDNSIFKQPSN